MRAVGKASAGMARGYSVVAWGRNTEGQCGVNAYLPLLLQAREVEALARLPVAGLTAGKTHSAAVLAGGEALTWGDGRDGKLGHGTTDSAHVPHFVESLAGRVHVTATALGRQHTLFLDSSGQAWATGENREGQCGLGTPPEEAARKQRRQFEGGAFASWQPGGPAGLPTAAATAAGGGGSAAQRQQSGSAAAAAQSYEQQQFERSVEWFSQNAWQTTNLKPFLEYRQRAEELEAAVSMYDRSMQSLVARKSAWQRFEAAKGSDLSIPGLMPGQISTPVRLGRARHGIFSPMVAELAGLDAQRIVQLSAGRFMSAAVTAAGEVWTFGGGFGAEQRSSGTHGGTHYGGLSSAPRRVDGLLAQVLADNGGAVKVAAGGAFCVALTASGRVVLWGQPRGNEAAPGVQPAAAAAAAITSPQLPSQHGRRRRATARMPVAAAAAAEPAASEPQAEQQQAAAAAGAGAGAAVEQEEMPNLRILKQPGMLVAEVVDLPPMTDVAVGYTHITMTDGSSVWTIGRHTPATGSAAPDMQWLQPKRVMHQPDDGISSLAAGAFSTAAITGAGELYLWGTLLTENASAALLKQSEEEGLGHWSYSGTADPAAMRWSGWEGMGGVHPRRVPGLHKVQQVALGTHHAMAVVA
ncbi:hypothetical protein D9Q98_010543 [Chlorella vulgaris]|uniref:Uncharacterized protein n=1 Tax=Chlorella vulgaris TaxID=3077 RepID=A0A9D4YXW7_CHLVU|nr:hypothetical protein D9Q98_010543 [Chlorella vulgaris]